MAKPNKKYTGKLVTVKYTDRPTPISGFVLDYNKDWILLKYNETDYVMDGYKIIRHKNIESFTRGTYEKFKEKVIKLKKQHIVDFELFELANLNTILSYLTDVYGVFQFELKNESICWLGKLSSLKKNKVIIDYLNPKGIWSEQKQFKLASIRTIDFDTDYINSLKLISQSNKL